MKNVLLFLVSCAMAAFGHPIWLPLLAPLAIFCAYAIFWSLETRRPFLMAAVWFALVQSAHISFLSSAEYQGSYIYLVYVLLCGLFGLQFALLSHFVRSEAAIWGLAGGWILLEYSRNYLFTGFPWSPLALHYLALPNGAHLAAYVGVYGMSGLVILLNLLVLRRRWYGVLALSTLVSGALLMDLPIAGNDGQIRVALVQPGKEPREILAQRGKHMGEFGLEQWSEAAEWLESLDEELDLIAFPEGFVPYGSRSALYPLDMVPAELQHASEPPWQRLRETQWGATPYVSNGYWGFALAKRHRAMVVVGMDDYDGEDAYNAALAFTPENDTPLRYGKRILLPMGEYIPGEWAREIAAIYGVHGSFTPGTESVVFPPYGAVPPLAMTICSEETYSHIGYEAFHAGARLLVNISNDAWYPDGRLQILHMQHGRLRAAETGLPLLRSTNTGATAVIDAQGELIQLFGENGVPHEWKGGVLSTTVDLERRWTPYMLFGETLILGFALLAVVAALYRRLVR